MSVEAEEMLWKAITQIEAQETLVAIQVSAYPELPKKEKEKLHRTLHRNAYPDAHEARHSLTLEQVMEIVNG